MVEAVIDTPPPQFLHCHQGTAVPLAEGMESASYRDLEINYLSKAPSF